MLLKTWLPEREGAEQGHVLVWQGAGLGRTLGPAEGAPCSAQGVRHSLPARHCFDGEPTCSTPASH